MAKRKMPERKERQVVPVLVLETPEPILSEFGTIKNCKRVNIRSKPDVKSNIIGSLSVQDKVEVLSRDENWANVKTEHGIGYVMIGYIGDFVYE